MSKAPLMPMATAVWLVENTSLTFKQIAEFCKLIITYYRALCERVHSVEISHEAPLQVG